MCVYMCVYVCLESVSVRNNLRQSVYVDVE